MSHQWAWAGAKSTCEGSGYEGLLKILLPVFIAAREMCVSVLKEILVL